MTGPVDGPELRCGWMADQPQGRTCGDRAHIAVAVSVHGPPMTVDQISEPEQRVLLLCAQHADHPGFKP